MHAFGILIAALFAIASTDAQSQMDVCWRDSYDRGTGKIPNACKQGWEESGDLCYPICKVGYSGLGPVCWQDCPEGYTDYGALCSIPPSSWWPCKWYDVCGVTFDKDCPKGAACNASEGYEWVACSCYRAGKTIAKDSYGRGVGESAICAQDLSESGGLCYTPCKDYYDGVGPVCWMNGSGDPAHSIECNPPIAYGNSQTDCDNLKTFLKQSGLDAPLCIAALAESIIAGHPVGPQFCIDLIKTVLPDLIKTPVCHVVTTVPPPTTPPPTTAPPTSTDTSTVTTTQKPS